MSENKQQKQYSLLSYVFSKFKLFPLSIVMFGFMLIEAIINRIYIPYLLAQCIGSKAIPFWIAQHLIISLMCISLAYRVYHYYGDVIMDPEMYRMITEEAMERLLKVEYAEYDNISSYELINKINFLQILYPTIMTLWNDLFRQGVVIFVFLFKLYNKNLYLFYVIGAWIVTFIICLYITCNSYIQALAFDANELCAQNNAKRGDILANIFNVKMFSNLKREMGFVSKDLTNEWIALTRCQIVLFWIWTYVSLSWTLVYGWSVWSMYINQVLTKDFIEIIAMLGMITPPIFDILMKTSMVIGDFAKIRNGLTVFDIPNEEPVNLSLSENNNSEVIFENVSFCYPKGNTQVFDNLSINIKSGQKVGIVGPSGSGKSTFVKLLTGLYESQSGKVTIGGFHPKAIKDKISIVPQFVKTFQNRSVLENLVYNSSKKDFHEIAKDVHMDHVFSSMKLGYDTLLETSDQLSGGQMQRLGIIRGLIKEFNLILIDEGTANQDVLTEKDIKDAFDKYIAKNATVFIVSHKLATITQCDRILVFSNGKIVQDGFHEELTKQGGLYADLFQGK